MVNIRLNEFDRKILANIKPSDKWSKFKNIFVLNSEIKKLKIGNNKVGTKCAKHLRKLSNKNIVTLNEIKDGCKDLIPKKHKHGLAKDKTKKDVLKEHTKLDIGQDIKKEEKPKHKKPETTKKPPGPTQQLVNLLTAQQTAVRQQTIASNIQKVDQILTDRNQNVELPKQPQISQLQLTRQSLGQQRQVGGLGIYAPLPRRPPKARSATGGTPRPSMPSVTQNITGNVVGTTKTDEEILNQLRQNNQERLQQIESIQQPAFSSFTSRLVKEDNLKRQRQLLDDITTMGQNQRTERNQKIFENLSKKIELTKQIDQNLDFINVLKSEVSQQRSIADAEKRQDEGLNEAMNIMREKKAKQIEDTLGNLQSGVMQRVSGTAEQQNIFDRNTRLNLEKSESLGDLREQELELGRTGSFTSRLPETKSYEELQDDFKLAQRKRDRLLNKPRISNRQKRKQEKARELLELQEQEKQTSDIIDRLILDTEETNVDVDKFKKEMAQEEVAMEEDKSPIKMMAPEDIIGRPKSRYVIKSGLGTPSEVYGNADSTFYNKNYKDILNQYVNQSRNSPIYNEPMKNNYAQTWDIINKVKNAKVYTGDSKTKDLRHRKEYQKDLLKQLHARNVEQLMDRYLLEQNPEKKEYFKYAGIAAEQYFKSENPNEDPQYKLFNKINKRGKGVSISPKKFIEESKKLDLDDEDSKNWEKEAERLKDFHQEWDNEMSESAKRSYMAGSRDMFSTGLGLEGFNELPY